MSPVKVITPILLLAAALLASAKEVHNPFEGWDEAQVEKHRKKSVSAIKSRVNKWLKARRALVEECGTCRGKGKVKSGRRLQPCLSCRQSGIKIDRENFLRVNWEYMTPRYREEPKRRLAVVRRASAAKDEPDTAAESLQQISRGKILTVTVEGNFATARFEERLGREKFTRDMEWIEVDDEWWIADPVIDRGAPRIPYSGPVKPAAADPTPEAPAGKATPDAPKPGPTPKKPLQDPSKFFTVGDAALKHVEEDAWKVFGRVTNKTEKQRFAYIIVEVSYFKGDKLVDTCSCNVGTVILKPGDSATYSGYLYSDAKPDHDRVESKVAKFEELD